MQVNKSFQIAVGGIAAALSIILMFLGGVIWIFAYVLPIICSLLMVIIIENVNAKTSWIVYAVVSIISVLFVPDKECAMIYALFFGYYPMIYYKIARLKSTALKWIIRLSVFNSSMIIVQLVCTYIFGIPFDNDFGKWGIPVFLIAANILFLAYEKLMQVLLVIYRKSFKKKFDKLLKK